MGLPLLREAARTAGGDLRIESSPGKGTRVRASFRHGHIDRAPLGDIETTVLVLLAGHPDVDVHFRHERSGRSWEIESRDFSPGDIGSLREAVRRGEASLETDGANDDLGGCDGSRQR